VTKAGSLKIVALVVATMICGARSVHAEDDPEALIRQGNRLRQQGDNARAHGYFLRAYESAHTGRTAAQLGLVELALERYLEADRHLEEALGTSDAWVAKSRDALIKSRDRARAFLGRIEVHGAAAGTTVEIAGQAPVPVPADGVIWVAPGQTTLRFELGSRGAVSKEATVSPGASVSLDIEVPAVAAKPADTAPTPTPAPASQSGPDLKVAASPPEGGSSHRSVRIAGLVTGGAGVALGVTGFFVYNAGASKLDAIKSDAAAGRPYNESNGDYRTLGGAGIGLVVAGGAAVAAGAVLYLLNRDTEPSSGTTVSLGYAPGSGGAITIGGRFQ
jgi:hypothetical protein